MEVDAVQKPQWRAQFWRAHASYGAAHTVRPYWEQVLVLSSHTGVCVAVKHTRDSMAKAIIIVHESAKFPVLLSYLSVTWSIIARDL